MGVLIRSQGGERSYTLQTNKADKKSLDDELRQQILDVLKGLTFNIELKITDVIEASLSIHDNNSDAGGQSQAINATTSVKSNLQNGCGTAEKVRFETPSDEVADLAKNLEKVLANDDYRPPRSTTLNELAGANRTTTPKKSRELPAANIVHPNNPEKAPVAPESAPKPKQPLAFAPLQVLRRQTVAPTCVVSNGVTQPPKELRVEQPVVEPTAKPKTLSPRSARVEKIKQIKAKIDAEHVEPEKVKLPRGRLEIGKALRTCLTHQAGDEIYVAYDQDKILSITDELNKLAGMINKQPEIFTLQKDDVVLAFGSDQGWYRAAVTDIQGTKVTVCFFDWGLSETVDSADVKELIYPELSTASVPACSVKVQLTNADAISEESDFIILPESYDEISETYQIKVLKQ